jgi:hypothetical protein
MLRLIPWRRSVHDRQGHGGEDHDGSSESRQAIVRLELRADQQSAK